MELREQIKRALKDATKDRNESRRDTIRLLLNAMKNKEKEFKRPLEEGEIQQVIASQIKQRRDAIEQFEKGERQDLIEQEEREIQIFQEFLPEPLTPDELEVMIEGVMAKVEAKSVKDMGKVMKELMPMVSGRADGRQVSEVVRKKLQS